MHFASRCEHRFLAVLFCAALPASLLAGAQQPARPGAPQAQKGTARIRGLVVAADTGMPIRRAQVRLNSPSAGSWTATTDANGAVELSSLPAARFALTAAKAGFVTMALGQKHPMDPGRPTFELRDGQVKDDAHISLPRGGVVTGRVVDEFGDPVVDATVQAFQSEYMQGIRRIRAVRGVTSNDIGQFRLYGLAPGRTVIIFPDDRDRWTAKMNRYVSSLRADANGTFKVSALPPATYLAAVVERAADGEWAEPENLERLRAAATKFVLAEGETKTVTLRVNP